MDATEVVGANVGQSLGLAETGVGRLSVVVAGSVLGFLIIVPACGWAVGGVPPTSNCHDFFPKCFDLSHVEECEVGGDANIDGCGKVVVIRGFWS